MTGNKAIKIAVTGPESTGKSDLTISLARHFNGISVPEYAREYLNNLGRAYAYEDILTIAKQQHLRIQKAMLESSPGYIFFDTELTVLRIWCEYSYGRCFPWIVRQQEAQSFDLYLLTTPDLPWEPDPLREHPHQRDELFKRYSALLTEQNKPFVVVHGIGIDRLNNAIQIINQRF
jgi:NadR type nicotinamide-nucleotide adenylyltransferase